jgi:hypothetical protein
MNSSKMAPKVEPRVIGSMANGRLSERPDEDFNKEAWRGKFPPPLLGTSAAT